MTLSNDAKRLNSLKTLPHYMKETESSKNRAYEIQEWLKRLKGTKNFFQ